MDQAVVDDGAADLLVQLVQRLHLVHRDSQEPHPEKKNLSHDSRRKRTQKPGQAAVYLQ